MEEKMKISVKNLAAITVIVLPLSLSAFNSKGLSTGFGEHGDITDKALTDLGFSAHARFIVEKANVSQDVFIRQIHLKRHFDRLPNERMEKAYKRSIPYLERERERIMKYMLAGDYKRSLKAFGRSLHTIQDVFAHSNYCDMTDADQKQFVESVVGLKYDFPESAMIVSSPFGDRADRYRYSHREHAKDSKDYPEGPEAFERAMAGALEASSRYAVTVKEELAKRLDEAYGKEEAETRSEEIWGKFRNCE